MNIRHFASVLSAIGLALTAALPARALPTHTWVSGYGNDGNTGAFTQPFATLQVAHDNTAAGGVVTVIDSGEIGPVTISKSITIDGSGSGATVAFNGSEGIYVVAGPTDIVTLKHLSVNGMNLGVDAIYFQSGAQLVVEDCSLDGFTNIGIAAGSTAAQNVFVRNTTINGGTLGVRVFQGVGPVHISLRDVSITGATAAGVFTRSGIVEMSNSVVTQCFIGLENDTNAVISAVGCILSFDSSAVQCAIGSTTRLSNNAIWDCGSAIYSGGGGNVLSDGLNKKGGISGGSVAPSGKVGIY